jgi:hypothetical protein
MRAVVVYESMFGNTHLIADAVAAGLGAADVTVVAVSGATADVVAGADLLVVGGPTHVHGLSRASTRASAADIAAKPESDVALDPDAEGPGLRDWFDEVGVLPTAAAAFDTRMHGPEILTGRASKGIAKRLRRHGCTLVAEPHSFLVTKENRLDPEEAGLATAWGEELARIVATRVE